MLILLISPTIHAATYHVGSTRDIKTLTAIVPRLQPGDIVEIDPGTYREVLKLTANGTPEAPITIRGVGDEYPVFDAEGLDTSGRGPIPRAILQIEGAHIIVEHLAFKNARNGENAAGIRLLDSTNAVIRDCQISHCDMGIFGGDRETALIEDCEVWENGTEKFNGYSHNCYMSGNRVVVRDCYIHDALYGQNYKSRAHYNELWFNWITNSNDGEVGCVDGQGATDQPHSNVLMVGNVLISKENRTGNTRKFVLFGSESGGAHDGSLYLFRNTFIAGDEKIRLITLDDPQARAVIQNNVFRGSEHILNLAQPAKSVVGNHNLLPVGVAPPDGWTDDFDLPLQYIDGTGARHMLDENQINNESLSRFERIKKGPPAKPAAHK